MKINAQVTKPRLKLRVTPAFLAFWGVMLLLPPICGARVRMAAFAIPLAAAAAHECGHLAALALCGRRVRSVTLTPLGAEIEAEGVEANPFARLAQNAAGILANLACAGAAALLARFTGVASGVPGGPVIPGITEIAGVPGLPGALTYFALCSLALAAFNALPVRTLDGGAIAADLLDLLLPPHLAFPLAGALSFAALMTLWAAAVWVLLGGGGNFTLFALALALFAENELSAARG